MLVVIARAVEGGRGWTPRSVRPGSARPARSWSCACTASSRGTPRASSCRCCSTGRSGGHPGGRGPRPTGPPRPLGAAQQAAGHRRAVPTTRRARRTRRGLHPARHRPGLDRSPVAHRHRRRLDVPLRPITGASVAPRSAAQRALLAPLARRGSACVSRPATARDHRGHAAHRVATSPGPPDGRLATSRARLADAPVACVRGHRRADRGGAAPPRPRRHLRRDPGAPAPGGARRKPMSTTSTVVHRDSTTLAAAVAARLVTGWWTSRPLAGLRPSS
jgi:hypothetical protein